MDKHHATPYSGIETIGLFLIGLSQLFALTDETQNFLQQAPQGEFGVISPGSKSDDTKSGQPGQPVSSLTVTLLQRGGVRCGVNGTLKGRGPPQNYYIHPYCHRIHSVSKQIVCVTYDDTTGSVSQILYQKNRSLFLTFFFFVGARQVQTKKPDFLLWLKEKEVNNTPTPVYWINRAARMASSSPERWVNSVIYLFLKRDYCFSKSPHRIAVDADEPWFWLDVCSAFEWMEHTGVWGSDISREWVW